MVDSRILYTVLCNRHRPAQSVRVSRVVEIFMEAVHNFRLKKITFAVFEDEVSIYFFPKQSQYSHLPYVTNIQKGGKYTCKHNIEMHLNI